MPLTHWLSQLFSSRPQRRSQHSRQFRRQEVSTTEQQVQVLESRALLTTFQVTTLQDVVSASDGQVSLREAINEANSTAGADAITFAVAAGTINLSDGILLITDDLTITGPGAANVTINAQQQSRIFGINDGNGGNTIAVTLSSLTLTGGLATDGNANTETEDDAGGAIGSAENLTIVDSVITGNTASVSGGAIGNVGTLTVSNTVISYNNSGYSGGAIGNSGTLSISGSTLTHNEAGYSGGGIDNSGQATITGSTIHDNGAEYGGGIDNSGNATINSSAITGNFGTSAGGGIFAAGTTVLTNSTLANNNTSYYGGGLFSEGNATISSSTITGNSAAAGGGLLNINGSLTVNNSIVAGNRVEIENGSDVDDIASESFSGSHNVIGQDSTPTSGSNNILDVDWTTVLASITDDGNLVPQLANNGGPTQTVALVADSPAIDAGSVALLPADVNDVDGDNNVTEALPWDQRGQSRVVDDAAVTDVVDGLDIGAIEAGNQGGSQFLVTAPVGRTDLLRPTIEWTEVPEAISYNLFLNIDGGGGNVFTQRGISSQQTSLMIPQDLEFGRYRVFIEANLAGDVIKRQDQGHTFVIDVQADVTPVGATTTTTPNFRWNRVPGASSYVFFLNVPGTPITAEITDPGTGETASHTITQELARNDYKWWIRPVREVQGDRFLGPWSEASEFTTGGRTKIVSPTKNSTITTNTPTFDWPAVPDAQAYEVYVSRTGTPGALYRDAGITDSSVPARVLENGDYKVWIRTTLSDGSGVWGSGVEFTVNATATAAVATPISPATPGFNTRPEFSWQPISGATSYDLYLHNGTSSIQESGITGTTFTPASELDSGDWTWSVRSVNAEGRGRWSTPTAFTTNGRTQLLTPAVTTSDATPTFTWLPVSGAISYSIQVDNRTTSTANVIREDGLTEETFTPSAELASGDYRVWVRAISNNVAGPWSVQYDLTINAVATFDSTDAGQLLDDDLLQLVASDLLHVTDSMVTVVDVVTSEHVDVEAANRDPEPQLAPTETSALTDALRMDALTLDAEFAAVNRLMTAM